MTPQLGCLGAATTALTTSTGTANRRVWLQKNAKNNFDLGSFG